MKARGIVIIDYDLPGGFKDAAQEEAKLQKAIDRGYLLVSSKHRRKRVWIHR